MNNDTNKEFDIETGRKELLSLIHQMNKSLYEKYESGRVRDPVNERIRINLANSFFKGCRAFNEILSNIELEEFKEELEKLKEMLKDEPKR